MDSLPNKKRQQQQQQQRQQQQQQQPKKKNWCESMASAMRVNLYLKKKRFLVILVVHVVHLMNPSKTSGITPAKSQPPQSQWTDYLADHHGVDLGPVVPPVLMDEISAQHVGW